MVSQLHNRTKIFISYSHQDKSWLDRLLLHLKILERDYDADIWADARIRPGSKWKDELRAALQSAEIAILLISADFLGSDFILTDELPPLLTAADKRGVDILLLIISSSGYSRIEALSRFQAFNDATPLISLDKGGQEQVFDRVAGHIATLLQSKSRRETQKIQQPVEIHDLPPEVEANSADKKPGEEPKLIGEKLDGEITSGLGAANWKSKNIWSWAAIVSGILLLGVALIMFISRSNRSTSNNAGTASPSNTNLSQTPNGKKMSSTIGIEKGDTVNVFDGHLLINVKDINLDPASNTYKVTATIWSPDHERKLDISNQEVSNDVEYTYPKNGIYKIRILSITADTAMFSVTQNEN